ncbi:thioredoxin-like protein [Annulohypoxylon truncatum]|uniref:thioredoxin-like protein n=1 Tax=Annulohypoxylon truncatum TaxID=327061 RepID=UPI0020082B17|nr:thioredoxin-like protein [Annulohypoxylon truncatum]KAI1212471.1 thioredoxin-like protein [Annulohypoxylon truncatum]
MGGHIDLYIDLASLYSYIALVQVLKTRDLLKQHSVEIEIHPVLLGAINAGSGNKPPWILPAKAAHSAHDSRRSLHAVGLHSVSAPGDLFEAGKTQLPLRALHFIKTRYPAAVYLAAWRHLFHAFWTLHRPPNTAALLREALSAASASAPAADFANVSGGKAAAEGEGRGGGKRLFAAPEVDAIVDAAGSAEYKDALRRTTETALKRGAFGAPWLWVTNSETRQSEPFFGSDRWHHVYEFLGLPYQEVALLAPGAEKSKI